MSEYYILHGRNLVSIVWLAVTFGFSTPRLAVLAVVLILSSEARADITFENVTASAGFTRAGSSWATAWGDYNGDGRPDIFGTNHGDFPSLYLNNGDGTFIDLAYALIPDGVGDTHGATWADFDNDGDQDLLELCGGAQGLSSDANHLFVNERGGFLEQAAVRGLNYPFGRGRTPLWFDWDLDGTIDVILGMARRVDAPPALFRQNGELFNDVTQEVGFQIDLADYTVLHPLEYGEQSNLLLPGGSHRFPSWVFNAEADFFEDLSDHFGIPELAASTSVAVGDFNGDSLPDMALARISWDSEITQPTSTRLLAAIKTKAMARGFRFSGGGDIEVDFWPIPTWYKLSDIYLGADGLQPLTHPFILSPDNTELHGLVDPLPLDRTGIYLGYNPEEMVWEVIVVNPSAQVLSTVVDGSAPISNIDTIGWKNFSPRMENNLILALPDGGYDLNVLPVPQGESATNCGSVVTADFDNDTDLDLYYVCSGFASNIDNILYENTGNGQFVIVPGAGGALGSVAGIGDTVSAADYDVDGFVDLFVSNGRLARHPDFHGPDQLFRNTSTANHWIQIDLEGVLSNRDAIGATVWITTGEQEQIRFADNGQHGRSQDYRRLQFGLGSNTRVDQLRIQWPSGVLQELKNIKADQVIRVIESVEPSVLDNPYYVAGEEEGVFIWKDSEENIYRLRVNGGGEGVRYSVQVLSDLPFESVEGVSLESADRLDQTTHSFDLYSRVSVKDDGVDFRLSPNARALIAVEKEGYANPRQIKVGLERLPLTPVGWVFSFDEWPARPDCLGGVDLGLCVGWNGEPGLLEARWSGTMYRRKADIHVFSGEEFRDARGVKLESSDRWEETPNSISVLGYLGVGSFDGLDVQVEGNPLIGIVYEQDGLFPPHMVNQNSGGLGFPNAYWLPE